jgi:ABC-2 type transport system permease protein
MISWQKHGKLLKQAVVKSLAYRGELSLWLILDIVPMLVLLLVWVSVYAGQPEAVNRGYSLNQILQYYLLGIIINGLVASHFESWRVNEIREGKIDFYLLRPFPYPLEIFWRDLGDKCLHIICKIPFYFFVWWALSQVLPLDFPQVTLLTWLQVGLMLVGAYLVEFILALCIVFLGFWIEGAEGLEHFKWLTVTLLSGWMVPVTFMPTWLRWLVEWLPFKYMYAYPIGLLQSTTQLHIIDLCIFGGFLGVLILIAHFLWQGARYQYASHGG